MNKRTFLKHLSKYKGKFQLVGGQLRTKNTYEYYSEYAPTRDTVCPIEAVGLDKNNMTYSYDEAAERLKIDHDLKNLIVEAADTIIDSLDEKKTIGLRQSMLRVLGLKEGK